MARRKTTSSTEKQETAESGVTTPESTARYRVLVEIAYGSKRVKAGKTVTDIPPDSIPWLLKGNYIKKVR